MASGAAGRSDGPGVRQRHLTASRGFSVNVCLVEDSGRVLVVLPGWFWRIPYVAAHYPGAVPRSALRHGGNCQLFAYEVLAAHGYVVPDLRSDELWSDTTATEVVADAEPLDLVLVGKDHEPYGAHVGVVIDDHQVLHLCEEIGHPVIWSWADFQRRPRYRCVVGIKRPTARSDHSRLPGLSR